MVDSLKYSDLVEWLKANPKDVVIKQSTRYPDLRVIKYRNRVFYNDTWNRYLEECRGLVVDKDWNLVALPFRKIYNYGIEKRSPEFKDDEWVMVTRKVNGFMCAVSLYNNDLLYSTTGSLDSDFVDMAKEMLEPYREWMLYFLKAFETPVTMIFEICHKDDPHIIPEKVGVYWLANRFHYLDNLDVPLVLPTKVEYENIPECVNYEVKKFSDVKEMIKTTHDEGVVVYSYCGDGYRHDLGYRATKIKSPYYLVKKFFARCGSTDKLMTHDVAMRYPEEYHPLIAHIRKNKESFMAMSEQHRLKWIREYLEKSV